MSKISDALQQFQRWDQSESMAHLSRYVLEQDDASLSRIKPEGRGDWTFYSLSEALRPPLEWAEEDCRLH